MAHHHDNHDDTHDDNLYAVVAQYDTPEAVKAASSHVRDAGFRNIEAYVPFPIEGLDEDLGQKPTKLGWVVLLMGTLGCALGFFMQWYTHVEFYPLITGGKPMNSWPNFIIIMYEITIMFSCFTAGLFMIGRNGLPQYYHSIFNTPGFENATRDKFFLAVEARDEKFELNKVHALLAETEPEVVNEVEK